MNITLKTILCVTALIHCTQSLEGAITLNEGETFTYEFNDLPFLDFNPFDPPSASWQMDLPPLSSESSVMFKMEMFENSTTEPPVASMIFDATTLGGRNNAALGYVPNVWQDLQGAVTLTMLSGSSDFSRIYLNVTLDGDYGNWPNHYTSFEIGRAHV